MRREPNTFYYQDMEEFVDALLQYGTRIRDFLDDIIEAGLKLDWIEGGVKAGLAVRYKERYAKVRNTLDETLYEIQAVLERCLEYFRAFDSIESVVSPEIWERNDRFTTAAFDEIIEDIREYNQILRDMEGYGVTGLSPLPVDSVVETGDALHSDVGYFLRRFSEIEEDCALEIESLYGKMADITVQLLGLMDGEWRPPTATKLLQSVLPMAVSLGVANNTDLYELFVQVMTPEQLEQYRTITTQVMELLTKEQMERLLKGNDSLGIMQSLSEEAQEVIRNEYGAIYESFTKEQKIRFDFIQSSIMEGISLDQRVQILKHLEKHGGEITVDDLVEMGFYTREDLDQGVIARVFGAVFGDGGGPGEFPALLTKEYELAKAGDSFLNMEFLSRQMRIGGGVMLLAISTQPIVEQMMFGPSNGIYSTNSVLDNLERQGTKDASKGSAVPWNGGVGEARTTGTVWDDIKATQPDIGGTNIPKSFELSAYGKKYWVNPNGTKHMAEYSTRTLSHGQKMTEQQLLTSLQKAVGEAATSGYTYNVPVRVGNWELIFSPARQAGQLPVIKHALYIP